MGHLKAPVRVSTDQHLAFVMVSASRQSVDTSACQKVVGPCSSGLKFTWALYAVHNHLIYCTLSAPPQRKKIQDPKRYNASNGCCTQHADHVQARSQGEGRPLQTSSSSNSFSSDDDL